jgi:exosortase/archaeosortase family protein
MIALGTLVAWTSFANWKRRIVFVIAAAVTSILANGVRAWGTIFVAQYVGAERAGGFDHIVYGWVFFAVVIAAVLGAAWRYFEREPAEAGLSAAEADAIASRIAPRAIAPDWAMAGIVGAAIAFAALFQLG